jgi:hypothetical protein
MSGVGEGQPLGRRFGRENCRGGSINHLNAKLRHGRPPKKTL